MQTENRISYLTLRRPGILARIARFLNIPYGWEKATYKQALDKYFNYKSENNGTSPQNAR